MATDTKNNSTASRSAEDKALDRFADLMIEKIETIQSDWKKPWFTQGASTALPKNLNGREYNGMNSLMLMMHAEKNGYELPVWCTFDRVTGLNNVKDKQGNPLPHVSVNKGEKSFPVFITTFTCIDQETKERVKYDDYKQMSADERTKISVYPKLQVYNVFNVTQTNLKEARPELYQKLVDQNQVQRPIQREGEMFSFPAIDHMIEHNEWICPIKPTYGDEAYYSISKQLIVIPEKQQFKSGESFYSNLTHEMAHSTGAENQLNRLKPASFGSKEYAREELVAELTAALISQRYGMTKVIKEDSVPYLKNWLNSLKEEPSFIKTVLQDVKKASSMIGQTIDKVQMEMDKGVSASLDASESQGAQQIKDLGTYDIPKWALPYIINGDADSLSSNELLLVDKFIDQHFPDGFIPEVIPDSDRELNLSPAFGTRNESALVHRGESPYQAVDTVSVKFSQAGYFEARSSSSSSDDSMQVVGDNTKEEVAAKMPAQEERLYGRGR